MQSLTSHSRQRISPYCVLVFLYIISAIAFESTANTAIISTIAIYLVFASGIVFVFSRQKLRLNTHTVFFLLFCSYSFLMCYASGASPSNGFQTAYWCLTCSVLSIIVYWFAYWEKNLITFVILANIFGGLLLVVRIISVYGGFSNILEIASGDGENRIGDLLDNENAIGLFLASAILSCVFFLLKKPKHILYKILLIIAIVVLATMLLLTGSRKSTAFAAIGILLFLLLYAKDLSILKKFFLLATIVLGTILLLKIVQSISAFSTIVTRFEHLFDGFLSGDSSSYQTDQTRMEMIEEGWAAFCKAPLFGNGTRHSFVLFGTYSHNNFIELLMNYGIIGFTLYYVPYLILAVRLFCKARQKDLYAIFFLVFIILQLMLGIGWVNYYDRTVQLTNAAAWGYLDRCKNLKGDVG